MFLAWLWRTMFHIVEPQPILFYVWVCFFLTGLGVSALFLLSWSRPPSLPSSPLSQPHSCSCRAMSGTVTAGVLAVAYFTVNLDDATRVFFTVNLREIFAFPFLWAQIGALCLYLRRRPPGKFAAQHHHSWFPVIPGPWHLKGHRAERVGTPVVPSRLRLPIRHHLAVQPVCIPPTGYFPSPCVGKEWVKWLCVEALSVLGVGLVQLAPLGKVRAVLGLEAGALLLVCAAQFGHPMIPGSLVCPCPRPATGGWTGSGCR